MARPKSRFPLLQLTLLVPTQHKAIAKVAAKRLQMSFSGYIAMLIERSNLIEFESFNEDGYLPDGTAIVPQGVAKRHRADMELIRQAIRPDSSDDETTSDENRSDDKTGLETTLSVDQDEENDNETTLQRIRRFKRDGFPKDTIMPVAPIAQKIRIIDGRAAHLRASNPIPGAIVLGE